MTALKYVIIGSGDVPGVDFSQIVETSESTLRYSIDQSEIVVKFAGEAPSFLVGKEIYTHEAILEVMKTEAWSTSVPPSLE